MRLVCGLSMKCKVASSIPGISGVCVCVCDSAHLKPTKGGGGDFMCVCVCVNIYGKQAGTHRSRLSSASLLLIVADSFTERGTSD